MQTEIRRNSYLFGLVLPLIAIASIWVIDLSDGVENSLIGLLAAVPGLAAILGTVWMVQALALVCLMAALILGSAASNVSPQVLNFTLLVIVIVSISAIWAVQLRLRAEDRIAQLATVAAVAESSRKFSVTDYLTGHLNRLGIMERARKIHSDDVTVVIFDFDRFKEINDVHGHQVGDEFIKSVSSRIAGNLKNDDIFGRWGGDEFLAVLKTNQERAAEIVQRVLQNATEEEFVLDSLSVPVRLSAGLSAWHKDETFEEVFKRADQSLYEAKSRGGNQIVKFDELPNNGIGLRHAH